MTDYDTPTLYISIEDGMVSSVQSDFPDLQNIRVIVIDSDTDASPERALQTLQDDGNVRTAGATPMNITPTDFDPRPFLNYLEGTGMAPTSDEVDGAVEQWHESSPDGISLPGWLGWTDEEYADWAEDASCIPDRPLVPRGPRHAPNQPANELSLDDRRETAAREAYENYDFGSLEVKGHDGWQRTVPGNELNRSVYLEDPALNDKDEGHSIPVAFVVTFEEGTAVITDVDAYDASGNTIGKRVNGNSNSNPAHPIS